MKKVSEFYYLSALLIGALFFLLTSCGQKQEQTKEVPVVEEPVPVVLEEEEEEKPRETSEQVYKEVMEIHDRSMARMSEIRQLSRQLEDSVEHTNANPMEQEEVINRYRNHLNELKEANQGMLQWMRQFDSEAENMPEQEKLEYYQKEKEKINKVDRQVNGAISSAREMLQE